MTDTHIRKYQQIINKIQENEGWNTWKNDPDPVEEIDLFNAANQIPWNIDPIKKKDPYEGTNYREEWHIHRGWKYPCK